MALVDFIYGQVTDIETGLPVNVRKPDTNEKIVAWGAALNELAKQTVFADGTYQPTKSEILNAHPYFIVGKNPNYASPAVDYASNENVQLRAVSFKVFPGTFQIRMKTLGNKAAVKAQVFYEESETAVIATNQIGGEDEYYPIEYDNGSSIPLQGRYYITIPSDVVLNKIGNSVGGTLQFTVKEFDRFNTPLGLLGGYNVGSVSAATYNQLVKGVNVTVPEYNIEKPING